MELPATPPPAPRATTAPAAPLAGAPATSTTSLVLPGLLLLALAVAAFLLARRKRATVARHIEVLESASLGPRRAIVLARVGEELLVLGASEAGIALLSSRAAPPRGAVASATAPAAPRSAAPPAAPAPLPGQLAGLLGRLRGQPAAPAEPAFETLLSESLEDVELRRKLQQGQHGSVT